MKIKAKTGRKKRPTLKKTKTDKKLKSVDFEGYKYVLIHFALKVKANSLRDLPSNVNGQVWKNTPNGPIRIL